MTSNLKMSHGKMADVVSFALFGFNLVIEFRNFDFESHWNTLVFFDKKMIFRFDYALPNIVLFGFRLCCLVYNFGNKLRKTNLYFTEIV